MLTAQPGLPGLFGLPGDFPAARSYDCCLMGRALLAEGDIKFTVQAIKIEKGTVFLLCFPMCACTVSMSSSSHCRRQVAKFSDPCCKLALKCHSIPGALFISHRSNINKPHTSSYFEQR